MVGDALCVSDFGATGGGSQDDSGAIQDAVNAALAQGKSLRFPSGVFVIKNPIAVNMGPYSPGSGGNVFDISGQGLNTTILCACPGFAFTVACEDPEATGLFAISGLLFQTDGGTDRNGVLFQGTAFATFRNLTAWGLQVGFQFENVVSSVMEELVARWCTVGACITEEGGGFRTYFNANLFLGCIFAQCRGYGVQLLCPAAATSFTGCNFENNGSTEPVTIGESEVASSDLGGFWAGALMAAEGAAQLSFQSCYFEGNGQGFDLFIDRSDDERAVLAQKEVTVSLDGCTFNAVGEKVPTRQVDVRSALTKLNVKGCAFQDYRDSGSPPTPIDLEDPGSGAMFLGLNNSYPQSEPAPPGELWGSLVAGRINVDAAGVPTVVPGATNVLSATKDSTGEITVTFETPLPASPPVYSVTCMGAPGCAVIFSEGRNDDERYTDCEVRTYDPAGKNAAISFSLVIWSNPHYRTT